jgi:hypothetical protein
LSRAIWSAVSLASREPPPASWSSSIARNAGSVFAWAATNAWAAGEAILCRCMSITSGRTISGFSAVSARSSTARTLAVPAHSAVL